MIKVMVVEDERPLQRDIKKLIESTDPDFEVTSCADNGHHALVLLDTQPLPDILFTDIQMPVVDGLELIRRIRERGYALTPVIISGYNEFEYAKKALQLGVTDYLLKPVNTGELSLLLAKIKKEWMKNKQLSEKDYLSQLLNERTPVPPPQRKDSRYAGSFCFLLCAGPFPVYPSVADSQGREFWKACDLEQLTGKLLQPGETVWVFDGKTGAEKVVLYTLEKPDPARLDAITASMARELFAMSFPVTIGVSAPVERIEEIGSILGELRSFIRKRSVFGTSALLRANPGETSHAETPVLGSQTEGKLALFVQQGNLLSFRDELSKLFRQWKTAGYPQLWLEKLLKDILQLFLRSIPGTFTYNAAEAELEIEEAISISSNYDELYKNIQFIMDHLFDLRFQRSTDKDGIPALMQKIDRYLQTNLAEPINHQTLSELFGLVPSYLSRLFREYKGASPSDYLTALRMEKARELLQSQPELHAKEIAALVGYSDPLYFSKIFKKYTGLSPSEYRKSLEG